MVFCNKKCIEFAASENVFVFHGARVAILVSSLMLTAAVVLLTGGVDQLGRACAFSSPVPPFVHAQQQKYQSERRDEKRQDASEIAEGQHRDENDGQNDAD